MSVAGMNGADAYLKTNNITTSTAIVGKGADEMDMNDFLQLLVAQMTNQDMMNPTADTEYIAQMAQFSSLQGIQTIQEYQLSSYATSYVGKYVSIAHLDDNGGMTKIEGFVESVTFYDGEPKVVVGNISFPLYSVMEVKTPSKTEETEDTEAEDTDTEVNEVEEPEETDNA